MASPLIPPGPGVPPEMLMMLTSFYDAIAELQNPGSPTQIAHIDTAANLLLQAPAANWPNCAIIVDDKNVIAISTDVAGTYTWLRADGSAL